MAKRFGKGLSTNKGWGSVGPLDPVEVFVKSKISMELKNLGAKVGSEEITLNSIINSPSIKNSINTLKSRLNRLKNDKVKEYEGYGEQMYNDVIQSDTFKYGNLTKEEFKKLTTSMGKGNSLVGEKMLQDLKPSQIDKYLKRPSVSDDMKIQLLDLLGTKTSMGYTRATYHILQEEDYAPSAPYGLKKDGTPKKKPGRKPKPKNSQAKPISKKKGKNFKDRIKDVQKEMEEAPYGRKKDGTPAKKRGRKIRTKEERELDKGVEVIIDAYPPGIIDEPKIKNDLEKATKGINEWIESLPGYVEPDDYEPDDYDPDYYEPDDYEPPFIDYEPDDYEPPFIDYEPIKPLTPKEVAELFDESPAKIEEAANNPPKPGTSPKDILKEALEERNKKPITPEEIMKDKNLTPREKKIILEKLESDEVLDPDFIEWLERKLRRRVRALPPNFDEQNLPPLEYIKQAYTHKSDKNKIATENWFKCARIEFSLNIPRYPVLIELAHRVAEEDPNLLFQPRTEINLWYNIWGWGRADELISNLEAVSGLRADDDIQAYEDDKERNRKIRRWYANRLRYNLRQDLIGQGWTDRKKRDKELAKLMRQRGYEY